MVKGTIIWSKIFSWIITVSKALHTEGFCVLALSIILIAWSKSALSSIYVWQTPTPPVIEGIFAFWLTRFTKEEDPLGINKSIYLSMDKSKLTAFLSV